LCGWALAALAAHSSTRHGAARASRVSRPRPGARALGRVKEHCIQRGLAWAGTLAASSCSEQEYYEDLLAFYRHTHRVRSPGAAAARPGRGALRALPCACASCRPVCPGAPAGAAVCRARSLPQRRPGGGHSQAPSARARDGAPASRAAVIL